MKIVVEDPRTEDGTQTYEPELYRYEEGRGMWSLILETGGNEVERQIPRERVIYTEGEPRARR